MTLIEMLIKLELPRGLHLSLCLIFLLGDLVDGRKVLKGDLEEEGEYLRFK